MAEPTEPPTTLALARELDAEPQTVLAKVRSRYLEVIYDAGVELGETVAERDALRACLDAVKAVLERPWPADEDHHDFVNQQVEDARAALQEVPRG